MNKIKCFYFWEKNVIKLKEMFETTMNYFSNNIEMIPIELEYNAKTSDFFSLDFKNLVLEKTIRVKDIIESKIDTNEEILISDIDIVVYNNFESCLNLNNNDIVFQKESRILNDANTGFIFLKCNNTVLNLWKTTIDIIQNYDKHIFINEQIVINQLIANNFQNLKWGVFDDYIWAYSNPPIPDKILLHHVNCTIPSEQKSSYQVKIDQIKEILNIRNNEIKDKILDIF